MKKSKFILSLVFIPLLLSSCNGSLRSSTGLRLDDNEVREIELGYLTSRSDVASINISINLEESPLSDTITLASDSVTNTATIEYNRYANRAISYSESYKRTATSTATGFTTSTNTQERGYTWMGLVSDDEGNESYYKYENTNISYNNGYTSNNSYASGPIDVSEVDSYWGSYYIDLFYSSIFSQYIDETDSYGDSLYSVFSSLGLFDGSLTYVWENKGNSATAYYSTYKLDSITNPLYPRENDRNIPVVDLYDISFTFANNITYGYVLSNVSYSYQYQLLENFENHYLSNPRVIKTYNFDAYYSYSSELGMTQTPNLDTTGAIFTPLLTTASPYYEETEEDLSYNMNVSSFNETINMSDVVNDLDPSFRGYCYEILYVADNLDTYLSFTSTLGVNSEQPSYNLWGYDYIDTDSIPNGLITRYEDNFFKLNSLGSYSFRLFFDLEYNLSSIQVLVLSYT
ncbi:MAG: hypothetical protein LUD22_00740 [Coprobacillus sp.]|nr:hypothetical protein [Coprobacillus sp.]